MLFLLVSVFLILGISFLCSMSEAVVLSIGSTNVFPEEPGKKKSLAAQTWEKMRGNISKPIAASLILNTVANTGGSVIASSAFVHVFGENCLWAFSLLMTFLILFLSEILPKILGVEYKARLLRFLVMPLNFISKVFTPVIFLTELASKPLRKGNSDDSGQIATCSDILACVSAARSARNIDPEQEKIISNAIRLKQVPVRRIMIPKAKIQYIINGLSLEENEARFGGILEKTRYPVCMKDDPDTIIGTVNHKKFEHRFGSTQTDFTSMTREIVYVNENISVLLALKMMRWNKRHMLFVRDDDNVLTGLITLEDIMDELAEVPLPD